MSSIDNIKDNIVHDDQGSGHSTPTLPIKIPAPKGGGAQDSNSQGRSRRRRTRRRAPSEASSYSSQSADSTSPSTPPSARDSSEEETSPVEVATSPLLSYFLANASPTKSAVNFSFKNRRKTVSGSAPLVEGVLHHISFRSGIYTPFVDDDAEPNELPHVLHHSRRLSTSWANSGTIGVQQKGPITESQQERNTSLMRRLSLSGGMTRVCDQLESSHMFSYPSYNL